MFPGFGKAPTTRIVPVDGSTCRSVKTNAPLSRIYAAIRQSELQWDGGRGLQPVAFSRIADGKILLLADRKVSLDGVHLRNRGQYHRRADQIADLHGGEARHPIQKRQNLRETEIQLRCAHIRFRRFDRGLCRDDTGLISREQSFGGALRLHFGVELALRNRARVSQRRIALHVDLRQHQLSLVLRQFPFRLRVLRECLRPLAFHLIERRLKRARIDFEKNIAFVNKRPFAIVLPDQVAATCA